MTFRQFLTILWARKLTALSVLALIVLGTLLVCLYTPKSYKATTTLVIDYKGPDPVTGTTSPAQLMPGYIATQVDIITSRNVALNVVDSLGLTGDPAVVEAFQRNTKGTGDIRGWLADLLSKQLQVKPSMESSAIYLSYEDEDPESAAAFANAFAAAYIRTNLQLNIEPSKRAAEWFSAQVKDLRDNVVKAQQSLSDYQHENGIVSVDERLDVESARLAELGNQLVLAQAQTIDNGSKQKQVYSGKRLDQLTSDFSNSQQRESSIRAALEKQKAIVMEINQQRDKLGILQGDVIAAQKVLDTTMQRFSQTHLQGEANQSDVSVLDPATPPLEPSKPMTFRNVTLSIFLGAILAVGVAALSEMRDRRVHTPEDLTLGLDLPVLGVISAPKGWPRY